MRWPAGLTIDNPHAMDRKQISAYGHILVLCPLWLWQNQMTA